MTAPQPPSFREAAPPPSLAEQLAGSPPEATADVEEKSWNKGSVKPGGKSDGQLKAGGNSRNRGKKH